MSARPVQISLDSDLLTQVDAVSEAREKDGEASSERQRIDPMRHPKQTGFGFAERLKLVRTTFGHAAEEIRAKFERKAVDDDDILDALAALWTAQRIHSGTAVTIPNGAEQLDDCGLLMRMVA